MTSTITILCPEGIVLATDMREITFHNLWEKKPPDVKDGVKKIYPFTHGTNVAVSCWGLAEIITKTHRKDIIPFFEEFDKTSVKEGFTVDDIAEELKKTLESIDLMSDWSMGFHIAGFVEKKPKLRHVFHTAWHDAGEFTNEDCHLEYHITDTGDKVSYRTRKDYPTLFNGDSFVANALFNYSTLIQPYYYLSPHELSLNDCIELAKFVINTSIQRLDYFSDSRKFKKIDPKPVGGQPSIAKITLEKGFEWEETKK
jgi:hypothetical protein